MFFVFRNVSPKLHLFEKLKKKNNYNIVNYYYNLKLF